LWFDADVPPPKINLEKQAHTKHIQGKKEQNNQ